VITTVVMPQMGLEVTEGTVATIHVAVGAHVTEGDLLVEVDTDKALTDVVAPHAGIVRAVEVGVGDTVPLGATLVLLAGAGETAEAGEAESAGSAREAVPEAAAEPAGGLQERAEAGGPGGGQATVTASRPATASRTADGRVRAAPVARRAAAQLGVDVEAIEGTGPRGRITLRDVEQAAANGAAASSSHPATAPAPAPPSATPAATHASAPPAPGTRRERMSATRAAIARRMTQSAQIPQFTLEREIDASWLLAQKESLAGETGAGVTDLLLQAMAAMLADHPDLAAAYVDGSGEEGPQLLRREGADLGLAVATPRGLLVPVVRRVDDRSLTQIAAERRRLTEATRSGRIGREEMGGAAMTLSNLAGYGVDRFAAMVNPGESAILAVGRTVERVVPRDRGLAVVPTLALSLTVDHRVADGATGAAALVGLAGLLEGGMAWRP